MDYMIDEDFKVYLIVINTNKMWKIIYISIVDSCIFVFYLINMTRIIASWMITEQIANDS